MNAKQNQTASAAKAAPKTLTISEAVKLGFKTYRYGFKHYLPVVIPACIAKSDSFYDLLLSQFDGCQTESGEGDFVQVIEDVMGRCGLSGEKYIATGHYTHNEGTSEIKIFGAVEVAL